MSRRPLLFAVLMTVLPATVAPGRAAADDLYAFENEVAEHEPHADGLPKDPEPDLVVWSLIVFLLFLGVLTAMAWKPLTGGLDAREARIRKDIADAEAARVKSERSLSERQARLDRTQDEIKELLAEARRDAEVAKANILEQARTESAAERKRAVADVERAKDQALAELFSTMGDRVADATERVLGTGLTREDQNRLIDDALAQFGNRQTTAGV